MRGEWRNWAGDQRCRPAAIETPGSVEELSEVVRRASERGLRVRASASGHSFTEIALTDGVMVRFDRLNRILSADAASGLVKVEGGIVLGELNRRLEGFGLAFENLGDIDRQTIAGSISTGTHGTGERFVSISAQVAALELMLADGSLLEISAAGDPSALEAARLGLGALGLIYSVTVRTVPAFRIGRLDNPKPLDRTLASLDELNRVNDHFEFYVFPHTEVALCRESRRTHEPARPRPAAAVYVQEVMLENWVGGLFALAGRNFPSQAPRLARIASRATGRSRKLDRSYRVYASERRVKFTEMEYGIPREHAAEAVREVLEVAMRPEHRVAFPIEVRFAAADEVMLSAAHRRSTCYIAVHQDRRVDWRPYFAAVEAVMRSYGGRPHWGKRHTQAAETLAGLYPRWADFQALRDRLDPERRFANSYTERVLG
jgi:L-gulono-1,4-lactone dehydrogenase